MGLELVESDRFPTMATDGKLIYFNPAFVLSLSVEELIGVVAHEVNHPALMHHTRRGNRDPGLWNKAADYFINPGLISAKFTLPKGALIDSRFDGLSTDQIYSILESEQRQQSGKDGQGKPQAGGGQSSPPGVGKPGSGAPGASQGIPQSCGAGGMGEILDAAPANEPGKLAEIESDWQARVRQAVAVARKASGVGNLPGDIARTIAELNAPRVNWRDVLRRFIDDSTSKVATWSRPNRRFAHAGLILPGMVADRASHIVTVIDVSGSIGADDLAKAASELQAILDDGATDRVMVVYTDTAVKGFAEFEPSDVVELNARGGGGTDFRAVFRWIDDRAADASAIVFMTDCEVSQWGIEPACPVLWLVTGDPRRAASLSARAPFGESVLLGD